MIGPIVRVKTDGDRVVPLGDSCTFGRHPRNGIKLNHRTVSRFHGLFVRIPTGGYRVVDLGTKNGILVNGWRIDDSVKLETGDQVAVGNQIMVYHGGDTVDLNSSSGFGSTLSISTSTAMDGDKSSIIDTESGLSGHGVVALSALDAVESISESARQWFRYYFSDHEDVKKDLPAPIMEWLEPQVLTSEEGRLQLNLGEPFSYSRGDRRLSIRLQSDATRSRLFLLCTDERPLFTLEHVRKDFKESFQLTDREGEAIYYVSLGKTNPEIGLILGTSDRTIHKHLQNAYRKLGVENRKALIVFVYDYFKEKRGYA